MTETLPGARYYHFIWKDGKTVCVNDYDPYDFLNDEPDIYGEE
jgi:hypothetical protein